MRLRALGFRAPTLQSLDALASNTTQLADSIELSYGANMQTMQFAGRQQAFRPFANLLVAPDARYSHRLSLYDVRSEYRGTCKGYDTALPDFDAGQIHASRSSMDEVRWKMLLTRSSRYRSALARTTSRSQPSPIGSTTQNSPGLEMCEDPRGMVLPDLVSGTFSYNGGNFSTNGMRIVFERKLPHDVTATLDYAFGGVLDLNGENISWTQVRCTVKRTRIACDDREGDGNASGCAYALDGFLPLDERFGPDAGGYVQCLAWGSGSILKHLCPPTSAADEVHSGQNGSRSGRSQSSGARLHSCDEPGRWHGLPCAVCPDQSAAASHSPSKIS